MNYTVKYRLKGSFFWRTLKNIKGDLISPELPDSRIFITDSEERHEIPIEGTSFFFSQGRFLNIKQNMEKEAGAPIITQSKVRT